MLPNSVQKEARKPEHPGKLSGGGSCGEGGGQRGEAAGLGDPWGPALPPPLQGSPLEQPLKGHRANLRPEGWGGKAGTPAL